MSGSGTGTPITTTLPTPLQTLQNLAGGTYSETQLRRALDGAYAMLVSTLGHAFGDAFTIYCHDASTSTFTVDSNGVTLTADGVDYEFLFADYSTLGELLAAIKETGKFTVKLIDVVPPNQPSANLAAVSGKDIVGINNMYTAKLKQWSECFSGSNKRIIALSMPALSIISVVEDGVELTPGVDYEYAGTTLARVCSYGSRAACWRIGYWSCASPCNVNVTYVPMWFGDYPDVFTNALYGFAQLMLETIASGHYDTEQIGDYRYSRGNNEKNYAHYYAPLLKYQCTPRVYQ